MIRSGLTRLGQGEFGVQLDLPQADEFGELGTFFNAVSAQLSADRSPDGRTGGQPRVGGAAPRGRGRDRQPGRAPAVRQPGDARARCRRRQSGAALGALRRSRSSAAAHRGGDARPRRQSRGPMSATLCRSAAANRASGCCSRTRSTTPDGALVGVMLIVRNLEYLEPGRVDGALLAQAGRARPALGRRRARGEEPAQRDDDSPRAAAAAAWRRRRWRRPRGGGAWRRSRIEDRCRSPPEALAACRRHCRARSGGSTRWCRAS